MALSLFVVGDLGLPRVLDPSQMLFSRVFWLVFHTNLMNCGDLHKTLRGYHVFAIYMAGAMRILEPEDQIDLNLQGRVMDSRTRGFVFGFEG